PARAAAPRSRWVPPGDDPTPVGTDSLCAAHDDRPPVLRPHWPSRAFRKSPPASSDAGSSGRPSGAGKKRDRESPATRPTDFLQCRTELPVTAFGTMPNPRSLPPIQKGGPVLCPTPGRCWGIVPSFRSGKGLQRFFHRPVKRFLSFSKSLRKITFSFPGNRNSAKLRTG